MKYCTKDYNIYYEKYGTKDKNILILPGWGNTRVTFNFMIDILSKTHTVYILDYPGFGESLFPDRDLNIKDYTNLIYDFIRELELDNLSIIAHSFGGRIVTSLFTDFDIAIDKLVLIDVAGIKPKKNRKKNFKQRIYKLLKKLGKFLPKKLRTAYLELLIKIFASPDFKSLSPNMRNSFISVVNTDLKDDIKNIDCETLIIWGEDDLDTPISDGIYFNEQIKDSALIKLPKTGHFSYLEKNYYVNKIIDEFLKNKKD